MTPPPNTSGQVGWRALFAADGEKAWASIGDIRMEKAGRHGYGPMGKYQLFATEEAMDGGMMTKPPQMPHPFWLFYFNVDTVDEAGETGEGQWRQDPYGSDRSTGRHLDLAVFGSSGRGLRADVGEAVEQGIYAPIRCYNCRTAQHFASLFSSVVPHLKTASFVAGSA